MIGHGLGASIAALLVQETEMKRNLLSLTLVCPTGVQFSKFVVTVPVKKQSICVCGQDEMPQLNISHDYFERSFCHFSDE